MGPPGFEPGTTGISAAGVPSRAPSSGVPRILAKLDYGPIAAIGVDQKAKI